MDPLSHALSLLRVRYSRSGGFDAGERWSLAFAEHAGVKFYAVVSGDCWITVDGHPDPVRLRSGDCFLLPRGRAYRMASDISLPPLDASVFLSSAQGGRVNVYNGGGKFFSICGEFELAGDFSEILLKELPPIVRYEDSNRAILTWCVEQMVSELREHRPGNTLAIEHLAHMMLIQALRLHIAEGPGRRTGWLFALVDERISVAIKCMHDDPEKRWTVGALAKCAAMSRTAFSVRFKEIVGKTPIEYLTRWRMLTAADKMLNSSNSLANISLAVGYESGAAFATTFKRVFGCSPREYRRHRGTPKILSSSA